MRCEWRAKADPRWAMGYANANGAHKNPAARMKFKREGLKPGVPDYFFAVPSGKYHGLYIEFKKPGGKVSEEQKDWMGRLDRAGYYVTVETDAEKAEEIVDWYFKKRGSK